MTCGGGSGCAGGGGASVGASVGASGSEAASGAGAGGAAGEAAGAPPAQAASTSSTLVPLAVARAAADLWTRPSGAFIAAAAAVSRSDTEAL